MKCWVQKVCYILVFSLSELAVRYKAHSTTSLIWKLNRFHSKHPSFDLGKPLGIAKGWSAATTTDSTTATKRPCWRPPDPTLTKWAQAIQTKRMSRLSLACKGNASGTYRIHKKEALKLWRCHFARSYTFYQFALHMDWCAYSHPEWIQVVDSVQMTGHAGKRFATTTWIIYMPCWASRDHQPAMNQISTNSLDPSTTKHEDIL